MPESNVDDVRARFGATAALVAEHGEPQVELVREQLREFVAPAGDERAIDVGTGPGTLALALAPLVREVVGVDIVPKLLEAARRAAPANATFVEGDATALPFETGSFDLACSRRERSTTSPVRELVVAELARVTASGGASSWTTRSRPSTRSRAVRARPLRASPRPVAHAHAARGRPPRLFDANGLVLRRTHLQHAPPRSSTTTSSSPVAKATNGELPLGALAGWTRTPTSPRAAGTSCASRADGLCDSRDRPARRAHETGCERLRERCGAVPAWCEGLAPCRAEHAEHSSRDMVGAYDSATERRAAEHWSPAESPPSRRIRG